MWRSGWLWMALLWGGLAWSAPGDPPEAPGDAPASPGDAPAPPGAPEPGTPAPPADEPPPLVELPRSFREGWWWAPTGPRKVRGDAFSDVAIHPTNPAIVASAALDGGIWVSVDGARTWAIVLRPLRGSFGAESQQEEIMMRVEARMQDTLEDIDSIDVDDLDPEDYEDDPEDLVPELDELADELEDAAQQARDDVLNSLQQDPWITEQQDVLEGKLDAARPQVWFSEDGWLFAGRADGLHLSKDLSSWRQVLEVPVTSLAWLPQRKLFVAGTGDGVRFATDGVSWIDAEDNTEGLHIYDLAGSADGMYAGTSEGLYFAADAQGWAPVRSLKEPVIAVQPDPDWERGLWFGTESNLWRSDAGGLTPRAVLGAPLKGVVDLIRVGPGHLLASTADGPWESTDGGVGWRPMTRGLTDPDCRGLAIHKGIVLLASDEGLFRIEPYREPEKVTDTPTGPIQFNEGFVDRIDLIDAALARPGLNPGRSASRWAATIMPRLEIEAHHYRRRSLSYDAVGTQPGTDLGQDGDWRLVSKLTWTPTGRKTTSSTVWALPDGDGGVFIDDSDSQQMMVTRVARGATGYRSGLANNINQLYFARAELQLRASDIQQSSVLDQVEHGLRVAEVEAMLDAFTNGAVARWYASEEAREMTPEETTP